MQRKEFEKNWNQWKMNIRSHWNKLTDDDMYQIDGMWDQFIGKLAHRYGYSREMAEKEISNWMPRKGVSDWESEGRSEESPESEEERGKRKAQGKPGGSAMEEWRKPQEGKGWQQPSEGKQRKEGKGWQEPQERKPHEGKKGWQEPPEGKKRKAG